MSRPPSNSKFKLGDEVLVIDYHRNETVAHAIVMDYRGGRVAPFMIQVTNDVSGRLPVGDRLYKSARDMKLLHRPEPISPSYSLTTDEKLDLLLEHLGIEIEVEPRVIRIRDEKKSNKKHKA